MSKYRRLFLGTCLMVMVSQIVYAGDDTQWNVGVQIGNNLASKPHRPYAKPPKPHGQRPFPIHPHYPPPANGLHIIYKAPNYTTYNQNTYMWVNGDPNVAKIEASSYEVVTQWKALGLPPPLEGMYWIFENGRYALVPFDKKSE